MTHDHDPTPVLTTHARARCAEMGLSTKVAKAIVARPSVTYAAKRGALMAYSDAAPEYAVVYLPEGAASGAHLILTVLFREQRQYRRQGTGYTTD